MSKPPIAIFLGVMLALLLAELTYAENPILAARMDVFITANQPIERLDAFVSRHPEVTLRVHTLDAIENLEDMLSQGLPAEPHGAKRLALARLKQLGKDTREQLQQSATAIATALQYGVEQFPAIVFDTEFVVYGLTDPFSALKVYQRWRLAEAS